MKYLYFFIFTFTLFWSCKQEKSTCENGNYDQGEIGIDCGGICPDCVFDKNNILDKAWIDLDTSTHLLEHSFINDGKFEFHWTTSGFFPTGSFAYFWEWVNDSDTLRFNYLESSSSGPPVIIHRKILYLNDGAYKFKTDIDNWGLIYSAILFE